MIKNVSFIHFLKFLTKRRAKFAIFWSNYEVLSNVEKFLFFSLIDNVNFFKNGHFSKTFIKFPELSQKISKIFNIFRVLWKVIAKNFVVYKKKSKRYPNFRRKYYTSKTRLLLSFHKKNLNFSQKIMGSYKNYFKVSLETKHFWFSFQF